MPVSRDILRTYRGPRRVVGELLAMGPREDRAIAWLMIGCFIFFLARLPGLQREAVLAGSDFQRDTIYAFFALLMILPLVFYGIAFLGYLLARVMGRGATAYGARVAVFWGWLASTPVVLFYGMLMGFNGPEHPGTVAVGVIWVAVLLWFWLAGLFESSRSA